MHKIFDWKNRLHTVELVITTCPDDGHYKDIEAVIDGTGELVTSSHWSDVPAAMHRLLVSVNYFLDGHHNASHYTGKLSDLAR